MLISEYQNKEVETLAETNDKIQFQAWFVKSRNLRLGPQERIYTSYIEALGELAWQIYQLQVCVEGFLDDMEGKDG